MASVPAGGRSTPRPESCRRARRRGGRPATAVAQRRRRRGRDRGEDVVGDRFGDRGEQAGAGPAVGAGVRRGGPLPHPRVRGMQRGDPREFRDGRLQRSVAVQALVDEQPDGQPRGVDGRGSGRLEFGDHLRIDEPVELGQCGGEIRGRVRRSGGRAIGHIDSPERNSRGRRKRHAEKSGALRFEKVSTIGRDASPTQEPAGRREIAKHLCQNLEAHPLSRLRLTFPAAGSILAACGRRRSPSGLPSSA